jgi:tetratricopeptide (TPR) repeat protein
MTVELESFLEQVEAVLNAGDVDHALSLCDLALQLFPRHPEVLYIRAIGLQLNGQWEEALDSYHQAALARPSFSQAWCHMGLLSLEMYDFSQAENAIQRAIRAEPMNSDGWWIRSLMRELKGDLAGAERARAYACWLDPEIYQPLPEMDDEAILTVLNDALAGASEHILALFEEVQIRIHEIPKPDLLPVVPESPLRSLFVMQHIGLGEGNWQQPLTLYAFRQNIRRARLNREELLQELKTSLVQELERYANQDYVA